jgi:ABC-type molybdate transport system substrate-binding protein
VVIAVLARFNKRVLMILLTLLTLSLTIDIWFLVEIDIQKLNRGKVFIMYAGSLIKTFESTVGPSFQKETGYGYLGEVRGSLQIANMIIDGQRRPDIFSFLRSFIFSCYSGLFF